MSLFSARENAFNPPLVVAVVGLSGAVVGSGALSGVVRHHSDHVQQTGEQLQGEVKDTNPQTWGGEEKRGGWQSAGGIFQFCPWPRGQKVMLPRPLTRSLVFNEEKLQTLLEGVFIHVKLHLDPDRTDGEKEEGSAAFFFFKKKERGRAEFERRGNDYKKEILADGHGWSLKALGQRARCHTGGPYRPHSVCAAVPTPLPPTRAHNGASNDP